MHQSTYHRWLALCALLLSLVACRGNKDQPTAASQYEAAQAAQSEPPPDPPYPDEELAEPASDAEAPIGAATRALAAAPNPTAWVPTWTPPVLLEPTQTLAGFSTPTTGTHGLRLERTRINYTGYWGAWVPFHQPHTRTTVRDVEVNCINGSTNLTQSKWGFRPYLLDGLFQRVIIRGPYWEHCLYSSTLGNLRLSECWFEDAGAQGLQLRHTGNRADPQWANQRTITLEDCTAVDCGKPRGAGRAGFSFSIKDQGPRTDVVFRRVASRSVNQTDVRQSYDSFGAVCVEYCRRFEWVDGWVEHLNADRPDIQLFDYSRGGPTTTGPDDTYMRNVHVALGGDIAVRLGDGSRIDIQNCTGTGRIMVFTWNGSAWKLDNTWSRPIGQGLFYVRP